MFFQVVSRFEKHYRNESPFTYVSIIRFFVMQTQNCIYTCIVLDVSNLWMNNMYSFQLIAY